MAPRLRAVEPGETPPEVAEARTLVEAATRSRIELLKKSRDTIAATVDAGVPPHALARLLSEMNTIDAEIRRLEAAEEQEEKKRRGPGQRRSFNQAAI